MERPISFTEIEDKIIERFTNEQFHTNNAKVLEKSYEDQSITVTFTDNGWINEDEIVEFENKVRYLLPTRWPGVNPIQCSSTTHVPINTYISFLILNNVNPLIDYL